MLFKSAISLLSAAIILSTEMAGASSSRLERNAQDGSSKIDAGVMSPSQPTALRRKLKKDNDDDENSKDDKDATDVAPSNEEDKDGEVVVMEDSTPVFTPDLRSSIVLDGSDEWNHGSTAISSEKQKSIKVNIPGLPGDTVFLFLSITDGILPLRIPGWTRGAECFKTYNRQGNCLRAAHCIERDGPYCMNFKRGNEVGNGRDLATVLFYRTVTADDPGCLTIDLPRSSTTWATVTAITDVNQNDPIGRVSGTSCDKGWDSEFPSVYGGKNDVLLLSQCFDDTADRGDFLPPPSTERLAWTNSVDEAGFLYGKKLVSTGQTGKLVTGGPGGPKCKDALLSVVVNRN